MRKGLFARLAVVNIRKNKQIYVPYILACLFNVAMLYMMLFINHNAGMKRSVTSGDVLMITTMGVGVIVIFSFIFLLYSNSFLMKRRQKELGLYNILGLEKKHISWVMMLENLFSALISFVGGILVGILGSKLALLLLLKLIKVPASFGFEVSVPAIRICLEVFGAIFVLILLVNIRKVYKTKPDSASSGTKCRGKGTKSKMADGGCWFYLSVYRILYCHYHRVTSFGAGAVLCGSGSGNGRNVSSFYSRKHCGAQSSALE